MVDRTKECRSRCACLSSRWRRILLLICELHEVARQAYENDGMEEGLEVHRSDSPGSTQVGGRGLDDGTHRAPCPGIQDCCRTGSSASSDAGVRSGFGYYDRMSAASVA
jgi:hypothetical protein